MSRKTYLDILRILAIFLVLFNHTSGVGFCLFTGQRESVLYFPYILLAVFTKINVPLFFMISGALLLEKEESISVLLRKRLVRILLVLLLSTVVNYVYLMRPNPEMMSAQEVLMCLYTGRLVPSYWFFYTYIAFLLMLPLLRVLVKNMQNVHFQYLVVLYILFEGIQTWGNFRYDAKVDFNIYLNLFGLMDYVLYPLMGYYLACRMPQIKDGKERKFFVPGVLIAGGISMICAAVATHLWCTQFDLWTEETCQRYLCLLGLFPTMAVFVLVQKICERHPIGAKAQRVLGEIGACSLGIYAFETPIRELFVPVFLVTVPVLHNLPASLLWILCAYLLGLIITLILRRIPYVKKLF